MSLQVCNNSYFLAESGTCVKHCPDGEYEVGEQEIGRECKRCPNGINKCITASYASECKHHLYLTAEAECQPMCPKGFYRSPLRGQPIGRQCPRCPEDCNTCEESSRFVCFGVKSRMATPARSARTACT